MGTRLLFDVEITRSKRMADGSTCSELLVPEAEFTVSQTSSGRERIIISI
jgi:hypothetical protein